MRARSRLGNVFMARDLLIRGCGYCDYSERHRLPPLKKTILYRDQFFLSHAFRGNNKNGNSRPMPAGRVSSKQTMVRMNRRGAACRGARDCNGNCACDA
jgi:hypothetical protein